MPLTRPLIVLVVATLLVAGCASLIADSIESLMRQGIDLFLARRFDEAIGKFLEVIRRDPQFWNAYLYLARSFIGKGAWSEALSAIVQGLPHATDASARTEFVRTLLDGGTQALAAGNAKAAVSLLQEYVRHDASNISAYLTLGKAYVQDGSLANALGAFRRVLELNPGNAEAQQFLRGR